MGCGAEVPRAGEGKSPLQRGREPEATAARRADQGGGKRVGTRGTGPEGRPRPLEGCAGRLKSQRVNAHREAGQCNGMVSGKPASAWGKAIARTGPPDATFFLSAPRFLPRRVVNQLRN